MIYTHLRLARLAGTAGLVLLQSGISEPATANPQGAVVMGGAAQIVQTTPSRLDINQSSNRAVIDWRSFSVGAGETTNFNQPSSSSLAVNRVTGANPSDIAGRITANGQIVLVNPNGIVFQRDSRIDAASFVATTSGISVGDAMAGRLAFARPSTASTASIVNRGRITVKQGGLAALVAPGVVNDGVIRARLGKAVLAAGETFTLDLAGDRLINFAVDGKVLHRVTMPDGTPLSAAVANTGRILADGGIIEISVDAAKGVIDRAISMKGIAEAKSVHQHQGAIVLDGGEAGTVHLAGRLDASGNRPGEVGGTIAVTGANVALHGAALDASGAAGGGTIAIGGNAHGAGPLRNAARTRIDATSVLRADAGSTGNGGSVTVWSEQHTRFNGAISARGGPGGGDGGAAEVSSRGVLDFHGTADLRAPSGTAGTLLLDPNDFVIQSDGTSTRPLIGTSVLTVADLQNELALGNVSLTTGPAAIGTQRGDITVANDIAWSSGTTLSLSAHHDIAVNAKISSSNAGSLVLRTDNTGTGAGTITFGLGGAIQASGGAVSLYFNSNDNTNNQAINGQSFAATQSYAAQLTLSGGATATQYALVNTVFDLANLNNNPSGGYALGRNIDASPIANFPMIAEFSGLFDGQNQTIDKLTINSAGANVGLFAKTSGGSTVRNVGLTNLSVTATADNSNVGGLAGFLAGAIVNAYTTGSVTAPAGANAVGGLVGETAQVGGGKGSVAQSSSSATVTGGTAAGGLVGILDSGNTINQSFATGAVSSPDANAKVGGLVGNNSGAISDSYATGSVNGDTAGGLIGREGNSVTLSQVYAAGPVKGNTTGGLVGQQAGPGTITNAYWDTDSTGQAEARGQGTPIAAKGLTTAQLQDGTLPAGFDAAIWRAKKGSYPTLIGPPQSVNGTVFSGPGGLPLSGATVRLLVDGVDSGLTSTTTAGGSYSFSLPGDTIAKAGGEVLAVVTGGGSGNAFFDGATGSLGNLDIYGSGFLTVYSGAASLSTAATKLHTASGGAAPPAGVAGWLLFSPTNIAALSLNSGAGLWLNPTAGAFSLDLPLDNSAAATVLISSTGSVGGASPPAANQLLLLGNGGNYTFSGGAVGTLAASTGGITFNADPIDLTIGTISGVAGVAASGTVILGTSGNLTLAAGAPVSGSDAGTAVTLLAGGAFTNNAGAGAIQAGGGGNFRVYSQDPANDKRGGLAYDFKQYNATLGTPVLGTGSGFLYSIAPTITLNGVTKTYDGTTALPRGPAGITASGAIDGDTVTLPPTSGTFDTRNAGTGKNVMLAGGALGTAIDATGAQVFGYKLATLSPGNTIGTITPAALEVDAAANTKVYDGTTSAAALPTITAGTLAAGDSAVLSETYNDRNVGAIKFLTPTVAISDGNGGNNYAVTLGVSFNGTITPAPLTIAAAPSSKVYDGTVASSATPTVSGLVAGDLVSGLAESFDSRNAGARTLLLNLGFAVSDGNGGNNYALTTATAAGSITPAALTIAAAPSTKIYDGTIASSATPTASGLVAGDMLSGLAQMFDSRNAGSRTLSVTPGFAVGDGNGGNNYAVTTKTAAGAITPAPLTLTAATNTKVFNGGVDAAALPTITAGALAFGDSAVLSETYADPSVGTGKILTPKAAISDGNAGGNYAITLVANPTGVINPAPSSVVATDTSGDVGQPSPPLGGTVSGVVVGDIEPILGPPRTISQPTTVIASIGQAQSVDASIEQVQSAAQEIQKIATVNVLVPGRLDFVSRIVEGFDTKLKAPRQALFVVLPNEDGTVGAISVDDGKTVTLLDRPYAAAELRDGDTVAAEFGADDAELIFGRGKTTRPGR